MGPPLMMSAPPSPASPDRLLAAMIAALPAYALQGDTMWSWIVEWTCARSRRFPRMDYDYEERVFLAPGIG